MYVCLSEFAQIAGIKPSTLLSYRDRGLFPEVHIIAKKKCYLRSDVLAWERPKKSKPGPKGKIA